MKILFTGGGTGGHLFPIIAICRELRRLSGGDKLNLHYIGPKDPLGQVILLQENFSVHNIVSGKLRNYFSFKNITDVIFNIPIGCLQSFFLLLFIRPKLVFSKGGPGSAGVVLCAMMLRIPIFLHESDTVPGKSNKLALKSAKKVFISFPKTADVDLLKAVLVGNPIEKELLQGNVQTAKEIFNLTLQKPVILILGGSQGSTPINDFILDILNDLLKEYEVIHVCGKKNYQEVLDQSSVILSKELQGMNKEYANLGLEKYYHLKSFLGEVELKHAYQVASFIVSRAGSGSIFEIAACGKPSILIPLPSSAHDHQTKNAYEYAKTGSSIVIEQDNLTPHFFLEKIRYLLGHQNELEAMKQSALAFAKPESANVIAKEILEYLNI